MANPNDAPTVGTIQFGTFYSAFGFNNNENNRVIELPANGVLSNWQVGFTQLPQGNDQLVLPMVVTLRINLSDTVLTITLPVGSPITQEDITNSVQVSKGDIISFSADSPATSTAAFISNVSVKYVMDA